MLHFYYYFLLCAYIHSFISTLISQLFRPALTDFFIAVTQSERDFHEVPVQTLTPGATFQQQYASDIHTVSNIVHIWEPVKKVVKKTFHQAVLR
jgi:hypothetical protein